MKENKVLQNLNASIFGGFISGATIWAYGYLLEKNWSIGAAIIVTILVFVALYLLLLSKLGITSAKRRK